METFPYYILGEFKYSENKQEVINPYTLEPFAYVSLISKDEMNDLLLSLHEIKRYYKFTSLSLRLALLDEWKNQISLIKEDLVDVLIKESGKSRHYAEGEVNALLKRFEYIHKEVELLHPVLKDGDAGFGTQGKHAIITREPYGCAVCIAPFNYPVLTLMIKVIPALLGGNVVVAKPSLKTPVSTILLARAFDKAAELVGINKGIFNVVVGRSSEIGDVLINHDAVDIISFTGSTHVGKRIASSIGMKKFHAELGGKGTALVLDNHDMRHYAKEICAGALKFSGQRCDSLNRVIVLEDYEQELISAIKEEMNNWRFGDPYDDSTNLVPLIDESAADKVERLINDALNKGAEMVVGYERDKNIISPVLLRNVDGSMDIYYEEIFGPVITITTAKDVDDAIAKALDNKYGLDASIFMHDVVKAVDIAHKLNEGGVSINTHPTHGIGYFPFGGNNDSGIGREGIYVSLEEFTQTKTIVIKR